MEREVCEKKIAEHIKAIMDIYSVYNPDGGYMSICINNKGESIFDSNVETRSAFANNMYWKEDKDKPIHFSIEEFAEVPVDDKTSFEQRGIENAREIAKENGGWVFLES